MKNKIVVKKALKTHECVFNRQGKCTECIYEKNHVEVIKMKTTKALTILREANAAYPDLCIENYFDMETGDEKEDGTGDTLALFIGNEILGVVDEAESLEPNRDSVWNALNHAVSELQYVMKAVA